MDEIVFNNNIVKSFIEIIIWLFLALIYFQFLLPYYLSTIFNDDSINNSNNFVTNETLVYDKINYTNNNIYIQI
jgi:hypothetical protein